MDNIKFSELGKKLINAIRCNPKQSKTQLSDFLEVPWSSVSSTINALLTNKVINAIENNDSAPKPSRISFVLNNDYEIYVGISLGNSHIKIVFLDFSFNYVKMEYLQSNSPDDSFVSFCEKLKSLEFKNVDDDNCIWCAENSNDIFELREKIIKTTSAINDLKTDAINITAICFTFPGYIDFNKQVIVSTLGKKNKLLRNSNIYMFLTPSLSDRLEKNNIQCFIDHNVKSSAIAEKEALKMKQSKINPENMLVLYQGRGTSSALILNNTLFRGDHNSAGELGDNIFTIKIVSEYKTKSFESFIENEVFTSEEILKNAAELADILKNNGTKKDLLVDILTVCLYNIVNNLGINTILFSGKFSKIFPLIEMDLINKFQNMGKPGLTLMQSNYGEYSAAVGAAISCYYNVNGIPFKWD